jgi:zinc transport system permease protein
MGGETPTWADFVDAWELFRDPLLAGLIAGALLGGLGIYVVLRRMVFVSAALTQAAGLGVALSFFTAIHLGVHIDPILGAIAISLAASLLFVADPSRLGLTRESVLGLAFAVTSGAAVVVGSKISQEAHDIQAILLGTAVLVGPEDLRALVWTAVGVGAIHLWWGRGLVFASFDETAARVQGLPTRLLGAVVLLSIGVSVGVASRALGALPVFALTTLPALAALATGARLHLAFVLAIAAGAIAGVAGYMVAFFLEWPVGASQALVAGALALLSLAGRGVARLVRG